MNAASHDWQLQAGTAGQYRTNLTVDSAGGTINQTTDT